MEHLQVTIHTRTAPSINGLMAALVAELLEAEDDTTFDPLAERLTLLAVWADLCRLAGEPLPTAILRALGAPARPRSTATVSQVPVTRLCGRLLAELLADDVPDPLSQRYRLGLLWLDLCRLAGETPPGARRRPPCARPSAPGRSPSACPASRTSRNWHCGQTAARASAARSRRRSEATWRWPHEPQHRPRATANARITQRGSQRWSTCRSPSTLGRPRRSTG